MAFTVNEFEDLIEIIRQHPEWRSRLEKALFPDIDIKKALQDLADSARILREMLERMDLRLAKLEEGQIELRQIAGTQQSDINVLKTDVSELKTDVSVLKTDVSELKTDVSVLKTDVSELKTDVSVLKTDMSELKTDVSVLKTDVSELKADSHERKADITLLKVDVRTLKGDSHERNYRDKAAGLFGLHLKNGRDVTNEIADQLYDALNQGTISQEEVTQVLAADLLWGGTNRQTGEQLVLVLEASWLAEEADVERASARSAVLNKIGIKSLPIVGGKEWTDAAVHLAQQKRVVMTTNGRLDTASWGAAIR